MNAFLTPLTAFTNRLLELSTQASLVILLVFLVQAIGGRRLAPRVRYALWLVVVARLLLPVSLESGLSLFNFTTAAPAKVFHAVTAASKASASPAPGSGAPAPTAVPANPVPATAPLQTQSPKPVGGDSGRSVPTASITHKAFPWPLGLSLLWLTGVVFLLARVIWIPLRLNAQLARHEKPTSAAVFGVLEESKRLSGVNQVLPIVQSRAVASPALLGFIRPWLLLPEGLVEKFTPQELRLVFLHELAHLKRRDIAVNWLTTLLQILHWPNPLVWVAFARMRSDRELACDELALSYAREGERQSYGHAIIKLLEGFRAPATLPGLVGILEDQTHMQRRIAMIAQFRKMTGWSAAAAALVLGIGIVTLTDAQTSKMATAIAPHLALRRIEQPKYPGASGAVCVSPDGRYLIFRGNDAMLFNVETQALQSLGKPEAGICFSSDSRQVALIAGDVEKGGEVRVLNLDGTVVRSVGKFTRETLDYIWLQAWSPDGRQFAVVTRKDKTYSLALIDAVTGALRVLRPLGASEPERMAFSPDGRWLVYDLAVDEKGINSDIFVADTTTGNASAIVKHKADDHLMGWSPKSNAILFSSNRRGTYDAFLIECVAGKAVGEPMLVKSDLGEPEPIGFTRSGAFYFAHRQWAQDVYTQALDPKTGGASGEPVKAIERFEGTNSAASWSPDGRWLAYSTRQPPFFIRVLDTQTQEDRMVAEGLYGPKWSPDGKSLLCFSQWDVEEHKLYLVDVATGARRIIDDGKPARSLFRAYQWAPEGGAIYYEYGTNEKPWPTTIVRRDLATSREREIVHHEGGGFFAVSPDGRSLVYRTTGNGPGKLNVMPIAGGEAKVIYEVPKGRYIPGWDLFCWSADGRAVFVGVWELQHQAEQLADNIKSELLRVPLDGGKPEVITNLVRVRYPHTHPDGTRITYSAGAPRLELWVMEDFLPGQTVAAK